MKRNAKKWLPFLLLTVVLVSGTGLLANRITQGGIDMPPRQGDPVPDLARPLQTGMQQEISVRFQQAVMMLHARQYDYAVTALQQVLSLAPWMPEAHANMGFALLGKGYYEAARDYFHSAIDLRPQQINAYWGLAVSLEALCDIEGATGAMRSYVHLADSGDAFLPRARAALWEWGAVNTSGDSRQATTSTGSGAVTERCGQAAG